MKPTSILLSIVLGLASLSFVVWIGQMSGALHTPPDPNVKKPEPTADDLPLPKSGPHGKAEVDEETFKFGTRLVGSNDQHTFTLKNIGEGPLDFKLGKATCQCTGVEISKAGGDAIPDGVGTLAPGESLHILIKWKMVSIMDMFRHGAPVYTTDPDRRTIQFYVTGSVDSPFHIMPDGPWNLGEMSLTEPSKAEGIITSTVYDEFTLSEEPRENAKVTVTWEPLKLEELRSNEVKHDHPEAEKSEEPPARTKKSGYKIKVAAGPNVPVGTFRESIKLKVVAVNKEFGGSTVVADSKAVGDSYEQIVEFSVTGLRSGPIAIRGVPGGGFNPNSNRLVFPDFPAATGKTLKMTVFIKGMDEDLVLKSVEPENTRFKVNLHPADKTLGKSKSYVLEVEIPPGPVGRHRAEGAEEITLRLNHPESPDFKMILDYNATR